MSSENPLASPSGSRPGSPSKNPLTDPSMESPKKKKAQTRKVAAFERICGELDAYGAGQITVQDFVERIRAARQDAEHGALPVVGAGRLSQDDVMKAFKLEWAPRGQNQRDWMNPPERIRFSHCFGEVMEHLVDITKDSPQNETVVRARINLLLIEVLWQMNQERLESAQMMNLQMENQRSFTYEPIIYNGKPHRIEGRPDYSLWYGSIEETSCNLVIFETKAPDGATQGKAQTIAYMAMVHRRRKEMGKTNCTVYGVCTDNKLFIFYEIDNDGKIYEAHRGTREYEDEYFANVLAAFIHEAALLSPIQSRAHTRGNTDETSSAPPMAVGSADEGDEEMAGV